MSQGFGYPAFQWIHTYIDLHKMGFNQWKMLVQTEKDLKDFFQKVLE